MPRAARDRRRAPPAEPNRRRATARVTSEWQSSLELAAQPHPGDRPLAPDGRRRYAEHLGGFGDAQPGEVAQIDEPGLLRVQQGQTLECVVQRDDVDRIERSIGGDLRPAERDLDRAAAALL